MPDTFRRIDRPGHRPEQQPADQRFLGCSIQACKNLLNLRRSDIVSLFADRNSKTADKLQRSLHLFPVRFLMGPIDKRDLPGAVFLCHRLVGKQHEIFNQPGSRIGFIRIDIYRRSLLVQHDLALRKFKLNSSPLLPAAAQQG